MQKKIEIQAKDSIVENKQAPITLRERFDLVADYFINSDEKLLAWFLLFGVVVCIIGFVALSVLTGWLFTGLWTALIAQTLMPFFIALGQLTASIVAATIVYMLQKYCTDILAMRWRDWLTGKLLKQLCPTDEKETKNYLELYRTDEEMKNVSMRIQSDVKEFTSLCLSVGGSFLKSTLSIGIYVGVLWIVGGSISFLALGFNIVIPGYLVWIAIIMAIVGSAATYFIGKKLPKKNQKEAQLEASLVQNLELLSNNAENIALEGTESHYLEAIKENQQGILENTGIKALIQTFLSGFQYFYGLMSNVIPIVCILPLTLTGAIGLEQLGLISLSFVEVSNSLGWFAQAYEEISDLITRMNRIIEIVRGINNAKTNSNPKEITLDYKEASTSIITRNLTLSKPLPSEQNFIFRDLNLELKAGEHTLILGVSGLGKSTLFKALKGIWSYGEGTIEKPLGKKVAFFPQLPTVVNDTLMGLLGGYSKEKCLDALTAVGLEKHIPKLETKQDWSSLSGGEKQKIVFAKILLQKPDWLFLDEASSFLDEESEYNLYKLIRTNLKDTTIVSIAHRSTVKPHHHRIIKLGVNKDMHLEIVSDEKQDVDLNDHNRSQAEQFTASQEEIKLTI